VNNGQLLMSYPIALPADYDMEIIHERVRVRGGALDDRAGLACKAYCVRQVGVDGSRVNQYAPFYLWSDSTAAAAFLWGGQGFDGIVRDFERPRVHTWTPVAVAAGGAHRSDVTHAILRNRTISADADLVASAEKLAARVRARASTPGVHLALGGIDPATWQAVEFTTVSGLDDTSIGDGSAVFQVLHISQPGHL
jgi:hypothetical protein